MSLLPLHFYFLFELMAEDLKGGQAILIFKRVTAEYVSGFCLPAKDNQCCPIRVGASPGRGSPCLMLTAVSESE